MELADANAAQKISTSSSGISAAHVLKLGESC
jgi:hypothetical protein